jgi:membrane-associated phospholipid phosphatase
MNREYSAEEFLKIKTSLAYFYAFTATIIIGVAFQFISKMDLSEIIPNITFGVICSVLSFNIYRLNKRKINPEVLMWISAFTSISIPLLATRISSDGPSRFSRITPRLCLL